MLFDMPSLHHSICHTTHKSDSVHHYNITKFVLVITITTNKQEEKTPCQPIQGEKKIILHSFNITHERDLLKFKNYFKYWMSDSW